MMQDMRVHRITINWELTEQLAQDATTVLLGIYLKYDENGKLKQEMVLVWYVVDRHDIFSLSDLAL